MVAQGPSAKRYGAHGSLAAVSIIRNHNGVARVAAKIEIAIA
jgi:hypothetical protein